MLVGLDGVTSIPAHLYEDAPNDIFVFVNVLDAVGCTTARLPESQKSGRVDAAKVTDRSSFALRFTY